MRRARPRRAGPRPPNRLRGGTHPRLQHGVPQALPRGDRRLRSAVPDRRRRRGRLLAASRKGLDAGVQPGSDRLASPTEFGAHLLEAADRLRPGRGHARARGAAEVRRPRPCPVGGAPLRQRAHVRAGLAPAARVSRDLGSRAVPVALPTRADVARFAPANARMVPARRLPRRTLRIEPALEPPGGRAAAARRRGLPAARPGVLERRPGAARRRVASCPPRPVEPPGIDRRAPPAAADRAPARETPARPDSLAHPRHIPLRPALADEVLSLERPLAESGATAPVRPCRAAGGGSLRLRRRRARALGPRGPQRSARRRPSAHGPRRRSRRAAHPAAALAARRSGGAPLCRGVPRAPRRGARPSRLARGGGPRAAFPPRRAARRRARAVRAAPPPSRPPPDLRREGMT